MTRIDERGPPIRLDEAALTALAAALDREGVVAAALFGSHAGGRPGAVSDVDIAVWLDPKLASDERLSFRLELGRGASLALGTDEVDVVILNDAPPLLQARARRGSRTLVDRDPKARIRLETRALLDYLDTKPLRQELGRGLRNRLAEGRFGRS